ncbi:Maebl [Staphylococcus croceilyticus]|uniref:Maebl n=1 Tax=Staphylococcus croceilyticus TaxID=319942 RepID=A0ABY2KHU6_9STAP|nr:Maebl [Staphylococcus croceilyticus]
MHNRGRNQNNQVTSNSRHQYTYNTKNSRKDFVVSFITGALIGSAIGLLTKSKAQDKIDQAKAKEQEFKDNYHQIRRQAEENIENVKQKIDDFKNRKNLNITSDELKAQQNAIKAETSNDLADQSPQAQEIQDAKVDAMRKESHQRNNESNSAEEIVAQQNAIKAETSSDLADQSPQAQEIQEAKAEAKSDKTQENASATELTAQQNAIKAETSNDLADQSPQAQEIQEAKAEAKSNDKVTAKELAAHQSAVKEEAAENNLSSLSVTNKQDINQLSSAEKLAKAANSKKEKLANDKNVAKKTKELLAKAPVAKSKNNKIPMLVTKKYNRDEAHLKNNQSHASAKFDKGVITHDTDKNANGSKKQPNKKQNNKKQNNKKQNNNKPNNKKQNNKTPKQQQRSEKAKSKIDKRTFND